MNRIILLIAAGLVLNTVTATAQQQNADSLKAKQQADSLKAIQDASITTQQQASQNNSKKDTRPFIKRLSFDISTSFWATPSSVYFEFTPMLTYHFPKTFSVGTGPTYVYQGDRSSDVDLNGWGGKVFGQAFLTSWLYAWTEYQGISNQQISGFDAQENKVTKDNYYVDSWFLSLGVNIRLGKRHGISMQALYDVLYKESTSPYYSAWIYRVGFGF